MDRFPDAERDVIEHFSFLTALARYQLVAHNFEVARLPNEIGYMTIQPRSKGYLFYTFGDSGHLTVDAQIREAWQDFSSPKINGWKTFPFAWRVIHDTFPDMRGARFDFSLDPLPSPIQVSPKMRCSRLIDFLVESSKSAPANY